MSGQWVKPKKISVGLPLETLVGHDLAGLVGELKRTADRGGCRDGAQAAHRPQHQHEADH